MKLIYHDESEISTYKQVHERSQKVHGKFRPGRITGAMGFFYRIPDVYAYGRVENWIDNNEAITGELKKFVKRFMAEDYGFVTNEEYNLNGEDRWLCGSCIGSIARYYFDNEDLNYLGGVVLEFFDNFGLIYSIEEDINDICVKHGIKRRKREIQYIRS